MNVTGSLSRSVRGLLGAAAGASVAALGSAALDARAASAGAGEGLWQACAGLIAPVALPVGALVWALRLLFLGGESLAMRALLRRLADSRGDERAAWQATPPLVALASLLGLLAVSGIAARLFAAEMTGPAAFALSPLAILPVILALIALVRIGAGSLATRSARLDPDPRLVLLGSVLAFGVGLALLIGFGATSGAGGPLAILGVLRRQELDLRAPGLLSLIALGALLCPSPRARWPALSALLVALAPLALTVRAAHGASLSEGGALSIERQAPLSRISLGLLRRISDRDRDGVSALFQGGDCDDHDRRVSPRAIDVPGNGRDEDCQGGDAKPPAARNSSADE